MNQEMQVTSEYMKALAKGLDPFSKEPLPEDTVLNDISLSRTFYYVAEVFDTLEKNGGSLTKKSENLKPFTLTEEMKELLPFADSPTITELVRRLNRLAVESKMRRIAYQKITIWLLDQGYLKEVQDENKKKRRMPTKEGEEIGLQVESRFGMYSNYQVILYTPAAQMFLCDNMKEILEYQKKQGQKENELELEFFDPVDRINPMVPIEEIV